jgi:hypothetical protein
MKQRACSFIRIDLTGLCSVIRAILGFYTILSPLARITLTERWLAVSVCSRLRLELRLEEMMGLKRGYDGEMCRK